MPIVFKALRMPFFCVNTTPIVRMIQSVGWSRTRGPDGPLPYLGSLVPTKSRLENIPDL